MNILFLVLISSYAMACGKDVTLEKIFSRNNGLPADAHFEKYITSISIVRDESNDPLINLQSERIESFLNMLAVQCQQHLVQQKNQLHLGKLLVNPTMDLVDFLRKRPLPVYDFQHAFQSVATALETPKRGAEFFSLCLENIEKSCELTPESELCELKRTVKATAWKYSEVTHQLNQSKGKRRMGAGEELMNKLVLQTPRFVMDFAREYAADGVCKK